MVYRESVSWHVGIASGVVFTFGVDSKQPNFSENGSQLYHYDYRRYYPMKKVATAILGAAMVLGTARAATDKMVSTTAGDSGVVSPATGDVSEEPAPDRGSDREH